MPLKRLNNDRTATERIMGPVILMASFILITIMIMATMTSFFQTASGQWEEIRGTLLIGAVEYTLREPILGWEIDNDNITDRWVHDASENAYFYEDAPGEDDQIVVGFIRDNAYMGDPLGIGQQTDSTLFKDFVMIYTEFGWWDNDEWPISYQTLIRNQVPNSNYSVTEFGIRHNTTYALIITTNGPAELFEASIWSNFFNVKLGIPDYDTNIGYTSMWTILGQIMTASLPNVGYEVNLIIGATVYSGIGIVVFTVVTRALPSWISGG